MNNYYLNNFIQQFIAFVVPKGKKYLVVTNENSSTFAGKTYDYIILTNVLEKEKDILSLLIKTYNHLRPNGKLIIIYKNYFFSFFLGLYHALTKSDETHNNWLSTADVKTFLTLANFDFLVHEPLCMIKINIPIITDLINRLLLHIFPLDHFSFLHYIIATKKPAGLKEASVSIIVPARNEEGNIKVLFKNIPTVGKNCEIIFIEGHSKDETKSEIKKYLKLYKNKKNRIFRLFIQKGIGKADAVKTGFRYAKGEIIIIYDADMTTRPSELIRFYQALVTYKGDFINGSRLVYPIEESAMQFVNILGNKFFSIFYSWILGQPIKDTLCGTKALWRKDYFNMLKDNYLSNYYDPFGDFHLLLGASKWNLKIIDVPVRYYNRLYGTTNIRRFRNAWELFKLSLSAIIKLKMRM